MYLKGLVDEDFVNYKKTSLFLIFPYCSFKCDKEAKTTCCQNSSLASAPIIAIEEKNIIDRYVTNPITNAIVCGGLEPFDSFEELFNLIKSFRLTTNDDIVIYTGYKKEECEQNGWIKRLSEFKNIIIKFGRFIPNSDSHYDEILGVKLNSKNQYAEKIS